MINYDAAKLEKLNNISEVQ